MMRRLTPPHGWSGVRWELAIVTVGVLIALAAQQTVEALNWAATVRAERLVLHDEVRDNLNAVQDRLALDPCVEHRLADIAVVLDRASRGAPLGIVGVVGVPLPSGGAKGAWNIALTGQGLAHMPRDEQVGFSNAYANFESWDRIREEEREAWLDLAVLDRPDTLGPSDWVNVRRAYARALASQVRIASFGPFIFRASNMGQKPFGLDVAQRRFAQARYGKEICRAFLAQPDSDA